MCTVVYHDFSIYHKNSTVRAFVRITVLRTPMCILGNQASRDKMRPYLKIYIFF